jgi:methylmalonyl-CoA mutase cobalamin-binding subunit
VAPLKQIGVRAVFGPGSPTTATIELLRELEAERAASQA